MEIILLALAWDGNASAVTSHDKNSTMRIFPTRFVLPTDHISMVSITGSMDHSGRIFLGGQDGNLYEMVYGYDDDDGSTQGNGTSSGNRPSTAKRVFSLVSGGAASGAGFHCYKINHTGSIWNSILPTMVVDNKRAIVDILMDHERKSLYTLNRTGEIKVYDVASGTRCMGTVKTIDICRSYVTSVKQGRM